MSPDISKTTRIDFTDFFLRFQCAEDAHPLYRHYFTLHQQLAKLLIEHPAMKPNLQQTFNTPANSKNKVYFLWDFVLRTIQFLAAKVSPQAPYSTPMFSDVQSRAFQSQMLILDTTGQMEEGNRGLGYNDDEGVEFTNEMKNLAEKLSEKPPGCAGCGKMKQEDGKDLLQCAKCKNEKYCSVSWVLFLSIDYENCVANLWNRLIVRRAAGEFIRLNASRQFEVPVTIFWANFVIGKCRLEWLVM